MGDYRLISRSRDFLATRHVTVTGRAAGETVVLGNGFGTEQTIWRHVRDWLDRRYRVVGFDWVVDPRHYDVARFESIDDYGDDLLAVIDATGSAPCTLLAHSMACMAGVAAALREPAAFRRMVMLAPAPRYLSEPGYPGGFAPAGLQAVLAGMGENYVEWAGGMGPLVTGRAPGSAPADEFTASLLAMRPDVALSMATVIFNLDMRDRLDGFTVPTTLVQIAEDVAVPVEVGCYLHRRWPHSRLVMLPVKGHLPQLTDPNWVIEVLEQVLPQPDV